MVDLMPSATGDFGGSGEGRRSRHLMPEFSAQISCFRKRMAISDELCDREWVV